MDRFTRPIPTKGRDPGYLPQANRLPAQLGIPAQRRAITRLAVGPQIPTKARRCFRDDVAWLAGALTLPKERFYALAGWAVETKGRTRIERTVTASRLRHENRAERATSEISERPEAPLIPSSAV